MATSDKHCQTFNLKTGKIVQINQFNDSTQVMYDQTVNVVNAREVDSPDTSEDEVVEPTKSVMSKFNPPARHTSRHNFDSESESDSDEDKFMSNSGDNLASIYYNHIYVGTMLCL